MFKILNRIVGIGVLIIMMVFCISSNVNAKSNETESVDKGIIQPMFTTINLFQNNFDISTDGKATISSYLSASNVDQVKISGSLQQCKDGRWQTIKSWSSTQNATSSSLSQSYYVVSGYSYRYVSYGYTYKKGVLVESTSYTSNSKSI